MEDISFDLNQYKLLYSQTAFSTSVKDLDHRNEHVITFLLSGWLRHTTGSEEGNSCLWRNPLWESMQLDKLGTQPQEKNDRRTILEEKIVELRGCFLELQHVLKNERCMRSDLTDRLIVMERKMSHVQLPSLTDELRSFICNAMVTGLQYSGKDTRMNLAKSGSSRCYRQAFGRIRSIDCSLESFQNLGREVEVFATNDVSFVPSKFELLSYNKRKNRSLSLQFDCFSSMCENLRMRSTIMAELILQSKTDSDGRVASHQIIGLGGERWENA